MKIGTPNFVVMLFLLIALSSLGATVASAQSSTTQKLTNDDVVRMVKAKFAENVIIGAIETNESDFDLSVNGLFGLRSAGVSDSVISAMQRRSTGRSNSDRTKFDTSKPSYGNVKDLANAKNVYVVCDNPDSRDRIVRTLDKKGPFKVVNDPASADFFLEYKLVSRDSVSERGNRDTETRSQLTAYKESEKGRIVVWSDTAREIKFMSGGIGFQTKRVEIKLVDKFLDEIKNLENK